MSRHRVLLPVFAALHLAGSAIFLTSAAADHPVSASCLEGEYLTCVIARVA